MFEIAVLCVLFFAVTAFYGVALLLENVWRFLCSHLHCLNWFR
jgi:hypothetical protein